MVTSWFKLDKDQVVPSMVRVPAQVSESLEIEATPSIKELDGSNTTTRSSPKSTEAPPVILIVS